MRAVSTLLRTIFSDDNLWLNKLTLLTLQHPSLADLEKGADERAYAWYVRAYAAVADGLDMAQRHRSGEYPYLKLYGVVGGTSFTPHAELRFPIPKGFIAELVTLKRRADPTSDPAYDAVLCFPGAPQTLSSTFVGVASLLGTRRCPRV